MISRTYICRMPDVSGGSVNLDIAVRNAPGTRSAPVGTGGISLPLSSTGVYYEWRGRPLVFPNPATLNGAANAAFVPRARLNWRASIYRYQNSIATDLPSIVLSQSIVNNLDAGLGLDPPNFVDPSYGPTIRLINAAVLSEQIFVVHFDIMETTDEDRDPNGV